MLLFDEVPVSSVAKFRFCVVDYIFSCPGWRLITTKNHLNFFMAKGTQLFHWKDSVEAIFIEKNRAKVSMLEDIYQKKYSYLLFQYSPCTTWTDMFINHLKLTISLSLSFKKGIEINSQQKHLAIFNRIQQTTA